MSGGSTASLHSALLAVQNEAPTLPKNAVNPHFKSRYTPLDTVVEVYGPRLAKNGLTWTTLPAYSAEGAPTLGYRLTHAETGQFLSGEMPLMLSKQDAQGQGAAITYARRYALCAVLNIVADEDVDANNVLPAPAPVPAAKPKTLTREQGMALATKLAGFGVDDKKFQLELASLGADTITDLTTTQANALVKKYREAGK